MSETPEHKFGFRVTYTPPGRRDPGGWRVDLPHQSDEWAIHPDGYDAGPHPEALAALDQFIHEAHEARAALVAERQFNADRP